MFANKAHEEAYTLAKEGKIDEALIAFNKALETAESPDIYGDRGVLFIHKNDKENAMADFNRAIELQPDYSFRYSARAYAHEYFGDTESSIADYEKAIELDPSDAVAYNNLGLMQEKLGYKQMAQTNFELADKLAKQEKKLHEIMDDLEENHPIDAQKKEEIQPVIEEAKAEVKDETEEQESSSAFSEFSKLFTSKEQFKSFLKFLKNGFKIK